MKALWLFGCYYDGCFAGIVDQCFAWKQGKQDYVIGNVIGCSIVNLTIVVGAAAVISPIMVSVSEIYDMIALCCSAVCVWIFAYKNNELQRIHGCVMATMFVAYVVYRIL